MWHAGESVGWRESMSRDGLLVKWDEVKLGCETGDLKWW